MMAPRYSLSQCPASAVPEGAPSAHNSIKLNMTLAKSVAQREFVAALLGVAFQTPTYWPFARHHPAALWAGCLRTGRTHGSGASRHDVLAKSVVPACRISDAALT